MSDVCLCKASETHQAGASLDDRRRCCDSLYSRLLLGFFPLPDAMRGFFCRGFFANAIAEGAETTAEVEVFAMRVSHEIGAIEAQLPACVDEPLVHAHGRYLGEEQVVASQFQGIAHLAFDVDGRLGDRRCERKRFRRQGAKMHLGPFIHVAS